MRLCVIYKIKHRVYAKIAKIRKSIIEYLKRRRKEKENKAKLSLIYNNPKLKGLKRGNNVSVKHKVFQKSFVRGVSVQTYVSDLKFEEFKISARGNICLICLGSRGRKHIFYRHQWM